MKYIDLPPDRILSGRDDGRKLREDLELDRIDWNGLPYTIRVSEQTLILTSTFLTALFTESMKQLGLDWFYEKYSFAPSKHQTAINIAITECCVDKMLQY